MSCRVRGRPTGRGLRTGRKRLSGLRRDGTRRLSRPSGLAGRPKAGKSMPAVPSGSRPRRDVRRRAWIDRVGKPVRPREGELSQNLGSDNAVYVRASSGRTGCDDRDGHLGQSSEVARPTSHLLRLGRTCGDVRSAARFSRHETSTYDDNRRRRRPAPNCCRSAPVTSRSFGAAQSSEQDPVDLLPCAVGLPVAQTTPAGHPAVAAISHGRSSQRMPVSRTDRMPVTPRGRRAGPAVSGVGGVDGQERPESLPEFVGQEGLGHDRSLRGDDP